VNSPQGRSAAPKRPHARARAQARGRILPGTPISS